MAEGRCPPGQYPIGDHRAPGCAPIPSGVASDSQQGPVATGKWETRWGAIAEDSSTLTTGAAFSMKSKRRAVSAAMEECSRLGGKQCKLRLAYHNQCVAIADPSTESLARSPGQSMAVTAETEGKAEGMALTQCQAYGAGQVCNLVYSACSMSEFKAF
ncbi:DUF4189 domain-containing protein [Stenotrophomonas rhizophila]